jgi:hypothetical protein
MPCRCIRRSLRVRIWCCIVVPRKIVCYTPASIELPYFSPSLLFFFRPIRKKQSTACQTSRRRRKELSTYLPIFANNQELAPRIAAIDHESFSRSAMIALPPRRGSRFVVANERLESAGAFTKVMNFSIETMAPPSRTSSSNSTSSPSYSSCATLIRMPRREHFEWRHSSSAEIEALGGRHSGWKLVRMARIVGPLPHAVGDWNLLDYNNHRHENNLNRRSSVSSLGAGLSRPDSLTVGAGTGGKGRRNHHHHHHHRCRQTMSLSNSSAGCGSSSTDFTPITPITEVGTNTSTATGSGAAPGSANASFISRSSDGREVVAVFAGAVSSISMSKSTPMSPMSNNNNKSKVLRFRFLGTGADGSLGDRWAIMAVATALAIWNRDRRSSSANSADHSFS